MLAKVKLRRASLLLVAVLYGAELLDELIYGLHGAVLPYLKTDFELSYTQIGLLFTLPGLIGLAAEPIIGLLGDTRHRRALVVSGLVATALGLLLIGLTHDFGWLLLAFSVLYVASGAYVNLAQATLIDRDSTRAEQTMARWTLLGSIGVAISPLALTAVFSIGYGWRSVYIGLTLLAALYIAPLFKSRFDQHAAAAEESVSLRRLWQNLTAALRNRQLLKWIVLTELADLMLDKLLEVTGLYFHDVAGVSLAAASGGVAVFTLAWLIGNLLIVPLLDRVSGLRLLRLTAVIVLIAYALFLIVPLIAVKYFLIAVIGLGTAGWFAILRAKCYKVLPGQSGVVVAVTSLAGVSSLFVPLILGGLADAIGLQAAMWLLAIGPIALFVGVRS
jgi:FSR family fosmidomycin resistance protein-like MFS transporter